MGNVAIIVPMYQVEDYIERCVESLLNQTYRDIQIVLVDDGSTDETLRIARGFSYQDERVRVLEKSADDVQQGAAAARNRGLEYVSSLDADWIAFVDSDDYVEPDYVEYLLTLCKAHQAEVGCCSMSIASEVDGVGVDNVNDFALGATKVFSSEEFVYLLLTDIVPSYCPGKIYPASFWKSARFPESFSKYEDSAILYQVIGRANRVAFGSEQKYVYFQREGSLLHTFDDMSCFTDAFKLIRDQKAVVDSGGVKCSSPVPFQLLYLEQYRRYVNFCVQHRVEISISPDSGDIAHGISGIAQLLSYGNLFNREAFLSNFIFLISRKLYCWQRRVRHK